MLSLFFSVSLAVPLSPKSNDYQQVWTSPVWISQECARLRVARSATATTSPPTTSGPRRDTQPTSRPIALFRVRRWSCWDRTWYTASRSSRSPRCANRESHRSIRRRRWSTKPSRPASASCCDRPPTSSIHRSFRRPSTTSCRRSSGLRWCRTWTWRRCVGYAPRADYWIRPEKSSSTNRCATCLRANPMSFSAAAAAAAAAASAAGCTPMLLSGSSSSSILWWSTGGGESRSP